MIGIPTRPEFSISKKCAYRRYPSAIGCDCDVWKRPRQASTTIIAIGSSIVHRPNIRIDWDKITGNEPPLVDLGTRGTIIGLSRFTARTLFHKRPENLVDQVGVLRRSPTETVPPSGSGNRPFRIGEIQSQYWCTSQSAKPMRRHGLLVNGVYNRLQY